MYFHICLLPETNNHCINFVYHCSRNFFRKIYQKQLIECLFRITIQLFCSPGPVSWFCPRGEEIATRSQSVKGTNWNYPSFASITKILNTFSTLFLNASCARVPRQPPFFSNFLFFSKQQPATNFWQISRRKWRLLVLSLSFDGILNNHESNSSFLLMRVHLCRL